jgi:hypothetical protein
MEFLLYVVSTAAQMFFLFAAGLVLVLFLCNRFKS